MNMEKIKNRLKWIFQKKHMKELPVFYDSTDKSQYFNLVTINNMDDVQKHLNPIFTNPPTNYAFRGVNDASFRIFSTVQRRWCWDGLDDFYEDIPSYIMHQIDKARSNKCIMDNLSQDNDYNILALIQHFWGNSNLVDFSYSPILAFYFAWERFENDYPKNGCLKDYVSLYMINYAHPDMGGPIRINFYGSQNLQDMLEQSGIPAADIDANEVLESLEKIPYKKLCDGTVVEGGKYANVKMSVPYFGYDETVQVSNANILAQDGCFIQANSGEMPLEEYINKRNPYAKRLLYCFDIYKDLVEDICKKYNVPQNKDVIYPHRVALKGLYDNVMGLDKHVFREWILNGCNKFKFSVSD